MVARGAAVMVLVWLGCLPACTSNGRATAPGTESSATGTDDDGGAECSATGPYDAGGFTFRASCTYGLPSDSSVLAACDEWRQSGVSDWGTFIEGCLQKNGALSAQPCVAAGQVGECLQAASCSSQLATYFYGSDGAASFEATCVASVGATWTPD